MAKVRIGREEMESIVNVANRMAKRRHARFVIDHEKVEIVEEAKPKKIPSKALRKPIQFIAD